MAEGTVVVVGGTSGLGLDLAQRYAGMGRTVVISGRDAERASAIAAGIGERVTGVAFDLAEPSTIAAALEGVGRRRPAGPRGAGARPQHGQGLRHRVGHATGDAEARRVHRGRPRACFRG